MADKSVPTEMAMAWSNQVDNPPGYLALRHGHIVRDRCAFWSEKKGRSLHNKNTFFYNASTTAAGDGFRDGRDHHFGGKTQGNFTQQPTETIIYLIYKTTVS